MLMQRKTPQQIIESSSPNINIDGVEIHFNFNPLQGLFDDFKFKN